MSQIIPIYIPTYISDAAYKPNRVLPRLLFYNGLVECEQYYIESGSLAVGGVTYGQTSFPYFDNYNVVSGSFPTIGSNSLLFNNENASYGAIPSGSLYSEYWEKYVSLLYNPKTRLLNCSAIIPLADYFKMELNDVVNFRGNYYHLRAINDYSLKDGTCNLQLLGPIIRDTFFEAPISTPQASSSVSWSFTETRTNGTFTVFDDATTLSTLTANGSGNAQISQSHYVTASLSPVSYPSSGSVTMSINVNGGTTLSQTVYTNTTISASFLVASGSAYGITGSIEWNDGPPVLVSGYKVYFDFGNTSSYPGSGSTVTNLGTGGTTFNGTLINTPTYLTSSGGVMEFQSSSQEYLAFSSSVSASFTTMALIKHNGGTGSWGTGAQVYNGFPNIRTDNGIIITNDNTANSTRVLAIIWSGSNAQVPAANYVNPANINEWHSYAYTSNANNEHKMYLDTGSAAAFTGSIARGDSALVASYIGRDIPNNGYINGQVMAYLQYDTVLTSAEILQNYNVFSPRF